MSTRMRRYALEEASARVTRLAKLRIPQQKSFDAIHKLVSGFSDDLAKLTDVELFDYFKASAFDMSELPPQLLFALATGVGKTRLMGALIAYLFIAGQSKNVVILAPRSAILEKLERECQVDHPKYLFVDSGLIPEPNLCFRDNLQSFKPSSERMNVFVLSPQSITGRDRRFSRESEFRGFSQFEYLRELKDLVVFVDEAHHVGSALGDDPAAWMVAIRDLRPRLYFGLTATPRTNPGSNVVYEYDVATCLREARYSKGVDLIVEKRDDTVSDDDWDRYTIDFGLLRLERKRRAIQEFRRIVPSFPNIEPVMLICAKDTSHADEIGQWLVDSRGIAKEQVLITHSERNQTEDDIKRLVGIDQPANRVRIVVNVFQLTEGWDVTNVYVIAPLRAMATYQTAIQTMGRGLRLPAGRRVDNRDVDTLDVLCCGRESVEEILRQATEQFGVNDRGLGISVTAGLGLQEEQPIPTKEIKIAVSKEISITLPLVRRVDAEPSLDFSVETLGDLTRGGATALHLDTLERTGLDESVSYSYEDFVSSVHSKVLAELSYLSDPVNGEALNLLIRRFLMAMGAKTDGRVTTDPIKVALLVSDEIDKRYRKQAVNFVLDGTRSLVPADYLWRVAETISKPVARVPVKDWQ